MLRDISQDLLLQWCRETFDYLLSFWQAEHASDLGIGLLSAYILLNERSNENKLNLELLFDYVLPHYHKLSDNQ